MTTYQQLVTALINPAKITRTSPNKTLTSPNRTSLLNALSGLQPGDWLYCKGANIAGQVNFPQKSLGGYARITFDGTSKFTGGMPVDNLPRPAIYLYKSAYFDIHFEPGCVITNPGGGGILVHGGTHHCSLDGWYVSNTGADGCSMFPAEAPINNIFSRGEAKNIGLNHAYDPHVDKGSGLHGMNVQDTNNYSFHDNIIAIYGHDFSYSGGSILECGLRSGGAQPYNNHYYVKGERNLYKASTQTGGNGVNIWGGTQHDNTFHIIEVDDMMGLAVFSDSQLEQLVNVVVKQGTATKCCQLSKYVGRNPWDKKGGIIYQNVTPAP